MSTYEIIINIGGIIFGILALILMILAVIAVIIHDRKELAEYKHDKEVAERNGIHVRPYI